MTGEKAPLDKDMDWVKKGQTLFDPFPIAVFQEQPISDFVDHFPADILTLEIIFKASIVFHEMIVGALDVIPFRI